MLKITKLIRQYWNLHFNPFFLLYFFSNQNKRNLRRRMDSWRLLLVSWTSGPRVWEKKCIKITMNRDKMWNFHILVGLFVLVGIYTSDWNIEAFNVETRHYTSYQKEQSSMFGFSVAEYRDRNKRGWWAINSFFLLLFSVLSSRIKTYQKYTVERDRSRWNFARSYRFSSSSDFRQRDIACCELTTTAFLRSWWTKKTITNCSRAKFSFILFPSIPKIIDSKWRNLPKRKKKPNF